MVSTFWVGLDVGEESTNVCVLDQAGQRLLECSSGSSAEKAGAAASRAARTGSAGGLEPPSIPLVST